MHPARCDLPFFPFVELTPPSHVVLADIDKKIGEEDSNEDQPQSLTNLREFCREAGPKLEEHLHELQEGLAKGKKRSFVRLFPSCFCFPPLLLIHQPLQ